MASPESHSAQTALPPVPVAAESRPGLLRRVRAASVTFLILLLAAGLAVLFATRWDVWVGRSVRQTTDDAYLRSDITPLSAKIEGYVRRVPVDDFEYVKRGDLLVEIVDDDYRARLDEAQADLLGAEAAVQNLKSRKELQHAQIAEAQDAISATLADVDRTRKEATRQKALLAYTFGTPQKVEQAVADQQRFEAELAHGRAA